MISIFKFEINNYDGFVQSGVIYATSSFDADEKLKEIEKAFEKKYGEGITFSSLVPIEERFPEFIIVETHFDQSKNSGVLVNHKV